MTDYYAILEAGKFYHIYNRGNNGNTVMFNKGNYEYFLRKYDSYLSDYLDTYCYCLLPNHFHFLVQVKEHLYKSDTIAPSDSIADANEIITEQFRRFFISYSQAINKQQHRTGSLFQKRFKRLHVNSERWLRNLVFYIHANPQSHGIIDDFRMYPWSSYDRILLSKPTKLKKEAIIEWFHDQANYLNYHTLKIDLESIKHLMIED